MTRYFPKRINLQTFCPCSEKCDIGFKRTDTKPEQNNGKLDKWRDIKLKTQCQKLYKYNVVQI